MSQAARIQGGVLGKALEAQLKPAGFTLRHYMQSFELSSLGGWIATRSGGHYATLYTHIDDQVESLRVVTPAGTLELAAEHGGNWDAEALLDQGSHRAGAAGEWRDKFVRMPYLSEHMVARGIAATTFESAITWDRFKDFHSNVMDATRKAIKRVTGREGSLTCRFTHLYHDGPAPYFTLTCPLDKAKMLDQFRDIKHVALQALVANGGSITHHHAVGRLHRPYYDQQRPELFAKALRAAKRALDPKGMRNPGVLIDPDR